MCGLNGTLFVVEFTAVCRTLFLSSYIDEVHIRRERVARDTALEGHGQNVQYLL